MVIEGIITLLTPVEQGISKATGNPWKAKDVVIETTEPDGWRNTIALHTMNNECIDILEKCMEGDTIKVDVLFTAKAREYNGRIFRSTDVGMRKVVIVKQRGF